MTTTTTNHNNSNHNNDNHNHNNHDHGHYNHTTSNNTAHAIHSVLVCLCVCHVACVLFLCVLSESFPTNDTNPFFSS